MPRFTATESTLRGITPFLDQVRTEANCQVVHDSLHDRDGWTIPYLLAVDGTPVGFAAIAVGGPWKGKRTLFDFYLPPTQRSHFQSLLEAFLASSRADSVEIQTNLPLANEVLAACGRELQPDRIVFGESVRTALPPNGAVLRRQTSERKTAAAIKHSAGNCEWFLELDGAKVGTGGLFFHYNIPYADVYMEIAEPFRRRGFGSYFVQELQREAHALGAVPAARSNHDNLASHKTLQKAGMIPVGKILTGKIAR